MGVIGMVWRVSSLQGQGEGRGRDVLFYYVQNIHRHVPELCERRSRAGRVRKKRRSKKMERKENKSTLNRLYFCESLVEGFLVS